MRKIMFDVTVVKLVEKNLNLVYVVVVDYLFIFFSFILCFLRYSINISPIRQRPTLWWEETHDCRRSFPLTDFKH